MTDFGLGTAPRTAMTADANLVRLLVAGLDNVIDGRGPLARAALFPLLPPTGSARVPTERLTAMWMASLAATDQPWLGLKAARQWRFGQLQLTDYMFQTAPTVGHAIEGMIRFSALLNTAPNAIRLTPDERGDATLTYQIRSGKPEVDAMASQFSLGMVLMHVRHAAGREIRPLHLGLSSAAPPRHGAARCRSRAVSASPGTRSQQDRRATGHDDMDRPAARNHYRRSGRGWTIAAHGGTPTVAKSTNSAAPLERRGNELAGSRRRNPARPRRSASRPRPEQNRGGSAARLQ